MKKSIRLFTLLLAILLLAGCSLNGYRYVENGENSYISLKVEEPRDNGVAPAVYFSSIDEMKSDIKQGRFTEEELKEIAQFQKNSNGKILAPNIENLRNVTLPDRLELDRICWSGNTYGITFMLECTDFYGNMELYPKEKLAKALDKYIFNPTAGIHGIEKTEAVPNANGEVTGTARYYTHSGGRKHKDVHYIFSEGDSTYYVLEQYETNFVAEKLYALRVWCVNNTNNLYLSLGTSTTNWTNSKLTIEEISQIGFED